jgi:hypothetical protein
MKKLFSIIAFLMLISVSATFAQDKIYKKGGEVLKVKITEIVVDEIKYRLFDDKDGPAYTVDKDRIIKIVYQNGRVETFQSNFTDPELYADQKKAALKINFLSPLLGFTAISYEKNMKPGRSYEVTLGIIGLGKTQGQNTYYDKQTQSTKSYNLGQAGAYGSAGYKFIKLPDFTSRGAKFTHLMQGTYLKPELMFGAFSTNRVISTYVNNSGYTQRLDKKTTIFGGAIINLGKQWIFSDAFVVDIYAGLGYDINNDNSTFTTNNGESISYEYQGYHYGLASTSEGSGVGVTAGLKIGFMLGKKKVETASE